LTNDGPVFCAGADLAADPDQAPPRHGLVEILETILDAPKPIVGRIAGHCLGGGVGLAAACDLSIVADDARLGFTEVRLGVAPAIISVVCLPKMRRGDAAELFLSGEQITASRAVDVGLVNRAVPREALDGEVAATLARLLAGGPRALAASKDVLQKVPTLDRDEAFAWAGELSATLFRSEEAAAGQAAWREKVPAPWAPPSSD
jgi:methylglutaconyl-CoA hydratase